MSETTDVLLSPSAAEDRQDIARAAVESMATAGIVTLTEDRKAKLELHILTRSIAAALETGAEMVGADLKHLQDAVRTMRQHQVAYFKTRSPEELQASKKAEREVDRLLAELEPPKAGDQGKLFR